MNIGIILLVIAVMSCAIYLTVIALKAAANPDSSFSELEAAVSSFAMLGCSILISYFALTA